MRLVNNAALMLLATLLVCQKGVAQVDPWERVKLIEPGKKVQVKLLSGKTVNGKMEGWGEDGLSVRQGKDKVADVAKANVAQVAMVTGMSRKRKFAYGSLIGGGVVAGLVGVTCASEGGCGDDLLLVAAVGASVEVGLIAGGIAALFPPHKEVIYTAPAAGPPRK